MECLAEICLGSANHHLSLGTVPIAAQSTLSILRRKVVALELPVPNWYVILSPHLLAHPVAMEYYIKSSLGSAPTAFFFSFLTRPQLRYLKKLVGDVSTWEGRYIELLSLQIMLLPDSVKRYTSGNCSQCEGSL